ncbi:ZIP family metal transporter [Candidatus Peregrinibacteria bacterium]|nr:ZIP family metal transporter [Candidatus Peregrinibacteria bacterium]
MLTLLISFIFGSVFAVSLMSLTGVFLLSLHQAFLRKALLTLVSFAVGALFANVFLHILPEIVETTDNLHTAFGFVLLGIVFSFAIEKFIHWHHCHTLECEHAHPLGIMMLVGDGVHNFMDGMLIATTYLVDIQLGIATTIAVILHEIPQEIGDFAVLLHSGFSRSRALYWNFASALTAFLGAVAVLGLEVSIHGIEEVLLPIVAGNFLYIAGSDLIPELHKGSRSTNAILQLVAMIAGIVLMYGISA